MSRKVIEQINRFDSFRFDENSNSILNAKSIAKADIEQFLEIVYILDSNYISYEMTKSYDLIILGKK